MSSRYNRVLAEITHLDESLDIYSDLEKKTISENETSTLALADVQTISISSHRMKTPVRSLGKTYPSAYTRGQRSIAGSIIFTVFQTASLYELLEAHPSDFDATAFTSAMLDQLPPMDITLAFANEYGFLSVMALYGVEFVNEGQTMSIEDLFTENVVNYVARDFDPLHEVGYRKLDVASSDAAEWTSVKGSDLLREDDYLNVKNMLNPMERHKRRSNPFI
jgi:hypothetical protein